MTTLTCLFLKFIALRSALFPFTLEIHYVNLRIFILKTIPIFFSIIKTLYCKMKDVDVLINVQNVNTLVNLY